MLVLGRRKGERWPGGSILEGASRTRADATVGRQARSGRGRVARAADRKRPRVVASADVG